MLYFITGVSGSGKSEYAENLAVRLSSGAPLYYAATMEPYGAEGQARIARHHKLRAGKGFRTIECYRSITRIVDEIGREQYCDAVILLECMSNLLANEMFAAESAAARTDMSGAASHAARQKDNRAWCGGQQPELQETDGVSSRLLSEICCILRQCKHLIIVTNDIFSDGIVYMPETLAYMRELGRLNRQLADMAGEAVEVVYGIPMRIPAGNAISHEKNDSME